MCPVHYLLSACFKDDSEFTETSRKGVMVGIAEFCFFHEASCLHVELLRDASNTTFE
jgi:hypothetical protein